MSKTPELFTPEGFSPALAELNLASMQIPDRLAAVEELLRHVDARKVLRAARTTLEARATDHRDWGFDTPTHYRWVLGRVDPDDPYSGNVGIYQYKDLPPSPRRRFVEIYHTHRDGVVSLLARRGYMALERRSTDLLPNQAITERDLEVWRDHFESLREVEARYDEGDIMSIHPDEVHRLAFIRPGTLTLVVRPPVERDFSVTFDDESHDPTIIDDLPAKRRQFTEVLGAMLNN